MRDHSAMSWDFLLPCVRRRTFTLAASGLYESVESGVHQALLLAYAYSFYMWPDIIFLFYKLYVPIGNAIIVDEADVDNA